MLQSRGISDLLAAEKIAQEQIDEARKRKNKRLKDAQNEAKSDIEQFKGEREKNYKSLEQQVSDLDFFLSLHLHCDLFFSSNWVIEKK